MHEASGSKAPFQISLPADWKFVGQLARSGADTGQGSRRGSQGLGLVPPQMGTCLLTSPPLWLGLEWQEGTRRVVECKKEGELDSHRPEQSLCLSLL